MSKKRVLLLADPIDDQVAGVHTVVQEVLKELSNNFADKMDFIVFRQKKDPLLKLKQITLRKIPIPGLSFIRLFIIVPLLRLIYKADAVVEFAHFGPFNLPKRIKRITYIHDLTPILFPKFHVFNGWFLHELFLGKILRKADLISADSQSTANDIIKWYPYAREKILVNYLGAGEGFRSIPNLSLLKKHQLDKPYFMFVGTIEPRKGIDVLLGAFELFKQQDTEEHFLLIIGKMGWKMEALDKTLENYRYKKWVKYLGFVKREELISFYSMAKFLIMPSRYEGFGLPIIEARNCGTQSIVSNNSSLEEIGAICQSHFFKTNSEIELAEKMKLNPSKINADYEFTWSKHVHNLINHIVSL